MHKCANFPTNIDASAVADPEVWAREGEMMGHKGVASGEGAVSPPRNFLNF